MVLLTLRLTDKSREYLEKAVLYARSTAIVELAVFEISKIGHEHIHMLFEPTVTKSAWVQGFHKHFNKRWVGNKAYSCSELEKEKENFLIYCCKGTRNTPPDVIFHYMTAEKVTEYWQKYWSDKPIELDKTLTASGSKKQKPLTWSEECTKAIRLEYPHHQWDYDGKHVGLIFDIVMQRLGTGSKKLNAMIIRDIVYGQLNALRDGRCDSLNKHLVNQAFPDLYGSIYGY